MFEQAFKNIFLFAILALARQAVYCQDSTLIPYKRVFDRELRLWSKSFSDFDLSEFKLISRFPFEELPYQDTRTLKTFYKLYKPALTFTKDSSMFLDIYSYWLNLRMDEDKVKANIGVDQAISLCEMFTGRWQRIFFCGFQVRIEEAVWISRDKFILAGTAKGDSINTHPTVYIGDLKKREFSTFVDTTSEGLSSVYLSSKLKKLKIAEE